MILVLLGTQDKPFTRLLEEVDKLKQQKIIKDKIVVQAGLTKYKSDNMEIHGLIPIDEFTELLKESDLVITHGGVGSILSALKLNKKVIAIPRLAEYGEHTNNHQIQIVNEFFNTGYILKCDNPNDLEKVLNSLKNFKPNKYKSNTSNMIDLIENYIDNL